MLKPGVKTSEFQSAFHPVDFLTCIYLKYNISYHYSSEASTQCDKADNLGLKNLFDCPPLPAPNFEKLEKKKITVHKYTAPNCRNSKKGFFFLF